MTCLNTRSLSPRQFKDAIYGQLARIGKALASDRRLELLDLLCQGPRTVEALAGASGQSVANTSRHLQALKAARLVESQKHGLHVTYRVAGDQVARHFRELRLLAEKQLVEIDVVMRTFLTQRGQMEPVDRDEIVARVRRGDAIVLDVRPAEEYRAGHLPGAISVPLAELERRVADLPRRGTIVAYCRGPYCVMSIEAVAILRARGRAALRLEDGVVDWRARGYDVAVGDGP